MGRLPRVNDTTIAAPMNSQLSCSRSSLAPQTSRSPWCASTLRRRATG